MVSTKVKQAMRFHKSPKPKHSSSSTSSSQVQPKPPDIFEVLRLVDHLRDRESQLLTQLLQLKLINESSALESASRSSQVSALSARLQDLERDNERLRKELAEVRLWGEAAREESERRIGELQAEIKVMKESVSSSSSTLLSDSEGSSNGGGDAGVSSSQRIWLRQDAGVSSTVEKRSELTVRRMKPLKAVPEVGVKPNDVAESRSMDPSGSKREREIVEPPVTHFRYDIDENVESVTLRGPRVPKPPPTKKSSLLQPSTENSPPEKAFAPPPAPPPPPPLPPPATTSWRSNKEHVPTIAPPPPPPPPLPPPATTSWRSNKEHVPTIAPPPPPPPPLCPATAMARSVPPPPPPPPAPRGGRAAITKVRRVPEVVEFYHSLMRRDSRRDAGSICPMTVPDSSATATATTTNARDMIGEIENRSTHLLAIKTDVETQGDFIRFLIKEVEDSAFTEIDDVVPFVKWLDDELSYLVDERAVLKHFDWPEQKADALREAAFGYCDVKKLESEASSFRDVSRQPYGQALKKIQSLLEKLEHGVYNLSRMRESAANRYKLFRIPTDWMLDNGGIVSQIKLASVKLAMQFMKRVSAELENVGGSPEDEELIVQGVRFAFRVHQFAGGFDVETMKAFQELRDKARSCHVQCQNQQQQQQQKIVCKSITPC